MSSDPIWANNSNTSAVGGPVTGTQVGDKRGVDVAIIAGGSGASTTQATRIDEASATITYVGKADVGTANSAASWQIQRIQVSGTVTTITFADGDSDFDNIWDNRASLSYS